MISEKYNIILGSKSPRRKKLLKNLIEKFNIMPSNINETYPKNLKKNDIAKFLAVKKASLLLNKINSEDLLITADTIVKLKDEILNKPKDNNEAMNMLLKLSNTEHEVITGVCICTKEIQKSFSVKTLVNFRCLETEEIDFYIKNYNALDKAGGYGIQDWIGKIGITNIKGSYTNVMGLPLSELYQNLKNIT